MLMILKVLNVVGYCGLILINVASSRGWLGGTNAEISGNYQTQLTPSGWAFSIWGIIFLLQGCGVIYSVLPYGATPAGESLGTKDLMVQAIGYGWLLGWLFQCLWQVTFVWQTKTGMWLCLGFLIGASISFQVSLWRLQLLHASQSIVPSALSYTTLQLPTSINAAWLSVATSVGVLIVPAAYGRSSATLGAIVLAVGVSLYGAFISLKYYDIPYGLTLLWALTAVYMKQQEAVIRIPVLLMLVVVGTATLGAVSIVVWKGKMAKGGNLVDESEALTGEEKPGTEL